MVSKFGLHTDPKKIVDIQKFPEPSDQTGVRRFLGMASYYRRYICQFASIASPLHNLLKIDNFSWTSACQAAFETLKKRLTTAPVLTFPDFTKVFYLQCDASTSGIGCVLSHKECTTIYCSMPDLSLSAFVRSLCRSSAHRGQQTTTTVCSIYEQSVLRHLWLRSEDSPLP